MTTNLLPGNLYPLLGRDPHHLDEISLDADTWTLHLSAAIGTTAIVTRDPLAWIRRESDATPDQQVDHFAGLRIGHVVRRGRGKLRWRVARLTLHDSEPWITLVSMPTGTGTSGLALSPQTFGVIGHDAIAALTRADR